MIRHYRTVAFAALAALVSFNLRAEVVEIGSAEELAAAIAANPAGDYKLTADIDCSGWTTCDFSGSLDGDGKSIKGLTVPLFGEVTGNATIKNLVFDSAKVSNAIKGENIGILAVTMPGGTYVISDILFKGCTLRKEDPKGTSAATSGGYAGFVVGKLVTTTSGWIANCRLGTDCTMTIGQGTGGVGGIAGTISAGANSAGVVVSNCVNNGTAVLVDFTMTGAGIVSGISAHGTGPSMITIVDCTNRTDATFTKSNPLYSGIVNSAGSTSSNGTGVHRFIRCANYGNFALDRAAGSIGGIAGSCTWGVFEFQDCLNAGSISVSVNNQSVGGMVGRSNARENMKLIGCANVGNLAGYDVGGLVGSIGGNQNKRSLYVKSCLNRGTLTARRDGVPAGQVVGYVDKAGNFYDHYEVSGSLLSNNTLVGGWIAGAAPAEWVDAPNVYSETSEGLLDGTDLAALNAYDGGCNLWKQGSTMPILKIMPDEQAPDTVKVTFRDAEVFDFAVLKEVVILKGGTPIPPEVPAHEGCTFLGWDPEEFSELTVDTVVTATYMSGSLEHTVRFFGIDGVQIGADQSVKHGETAIAPDAPKVEGKLFVGWDKDFDAVLEDLDVNARYVDLVVILDSTSDIADVLSNAQYAAVCYRLSEDVTFPSDWTSVENFVSTLDGCGHVIHYCGTSPIFDKLSGSAINLTLDGENEGEPTRIYDLKKSFGLLATTFVGGRISGVAVRNYSVQVSSSADNLSVGTLCAMAGNGAIIEGCVVDSSVTLQTRGSSCGGLVGHAYESAAWDYGEPGALLLGIYSSTNHAPIISWHSNDGRNGGIIAACDACDATIKPRTVISNCVNYGEFSNTYVGGVGGSFGGIVGQRTQTSASGHFGTLEIVDCTNYGDMPPQSAGGGVYGGALGYNNRLGDVFIVRFRNYGAIGGLEWKGSPVVGGYRGGIIGEMHELYAGAPVCISDSANYGDVIGGTNVAGVAARVNPGASQTTIFTVTNFANYGSIRLADSTGRCGQFIGEFVSAASDTPSHVFGAWNCFFLDDNIVGYNAGAVIRTDTCITAADTGYTAGGARKALTVWAEANGYEPWIQGKVGDKVYPELGIFCQKPHVDGFMLFIR